MRLLIFIFWAACLSGCGNDESLPLIILNGSTMGTQYSININAAKPLSDTALLQKEIDALLEEINDKMSTYIEGSELMQINNNKSDDWMPVSPELFTVISNAQRISADTRGTFDITIGSMVNLWGFGGDFHTGTIPDEIVINKTLKNVGYQMIQLQTLPPALKKANPDIFIDLSAIAKGYAVDKISGHLMDMGLNDFMVEIGGEIYAQGKNINGELWRIGIEKPVGEIRSVQKIIPLKNMAMATSGNYRNYIESGDKRYSHILDPAGGKPVTDNLASVTVLHASAMQADALATAVLVMGKEKALEYAERHRLATFLITATGRGFEEFQSSAFEAYMRRVQ